MSAEDRRKAILETTVSFISQFGFWVCFRCGDAYALLHLVLTKVQEGGEEDDGNPWNTPDYRRQTICYMI